MVANVAKVIAISLCLLFVQGCRLNQVVPVGGRIESTSGLYDCAEDQTCIVDTDIGTTFPQQNFSAVPAPGYRFVSWKDEQGYLCRGVTTDCATTNFPVQFNELNIDIFLAPIFEIDLLALLPANTRGVFQIYPDLPGAIDTSVSSSDWGLGPLQIVQQYSAGMDIAGTARRLVLAQLSDTPDQFILLATLASSDVDTLSATLNVTSAGFYQGYELWSIDGSVLHFVKLDATTLAIAPLSALQQALDTYAGAADITLGDLSPYLPVLYTEFPNSLVYGLPELYSHVAAPGNGDHSLSQALAVNSAFRVEADVISGAMNFFTANAATFRAKLIEQLSGFPTPTIWPIGDIASVNLAGLSASEDVLPLLKTLFLDMDAVDYAEAVGSGGNAPWLNFKVGENPNSIFINFEFKDQTARDNFTANHLPAGFTLAPLRIVEDDTPRYFLVLNMYQSSGGLVEGARAEWSVFINDPDTTEPRFLVVQAVAETISADSVNLLTFGEPVTHDVVGSTIASYVGEIDPDTEIESEVFSSSIDWPQQLPETTVPFAREFVAANDYIFWGNGVADRGLYNSTVFNREAVLVDPSQFNFVDSSDWAGFVDPTPVHTLVYLNPLEIVISPWWNLDALYLDVTPAFLQELIDFKNGFYPLTIKNNAKAAIQGTGVALSATTLATSVPTTNYHFSLTDPAGLLTFVAGAGVYTPVAIALFDGETPANYLTLSVFQREGDACGTRAEWLTYVEGPDGRPETLRLDAFAADACLDPVSLMTVASNLMHNNVAGVITTTFSSPFSRFDASFDTDMTGPALAGLDWLETGDRACSLNNVCDDFFIDGQYLVKPAQLANSVDVQINDIATPWDAYIDTGSARASVRLTPAIQAMNPWRTMRSFAADAPPP